MGARYFHTVIQILAVANTIGISFCFLLVSMHIVFRGGLEDNTTSGRIEVSRNAENIKTVRDLLLYIEKYHLKNGYKYFSTNGELEGGILCVVNNKDWDILQREDTLLGDTDVIHFISTMHGG